MENQNIKARMQQKHDIASNWKGINNFVPKSGEIIVYDKDEYTQKQRIKIGDGESHVNELNHITGELYTSKKEPRDAGEGAVWITVDGAQSGGYDAGIVGYKYGEVTFESPIPSWNTAKYPFGTIWYSTVSESYALLVMSEYPEPYYDSNEEFAGIIWPKREVDGVVEKYKRREWSYKKEEGTWEVSGDGLEYESEEVDFRKHEIAWVSADVMNGNIVVLPTTDPIPIYEQGDNNFKNSDWNINDESIEGYIHNRPFWHQQGRVLASWQSDGGSHQIAENLPAAYLISSLAPRQFEMSEISIYITNGIIPFSNTTISSYPDYDDSKYSYNLLVFEYSQNQVDWSSAYLYYSIEPFISINNEYITNSTIARCKKLIKGSDNWTDAGVSDSKELDIRFSETTSNSTGIRCVSNHDIITEETGQVFLEANEISPIIHGESWIIENYISTPEELKAAQVAENADAKKIYIVKGTALGYTGDSLFIVTFINSNGVQIYFLGYIASSSYGDLPAGTYFFRNEPFDTANYIASLDFNYSAVKVSDIYKDVLKDPEASNVYVLNTTSENLASELKRFKPGDVVLIPSNLLGDDAE